ncbi:MAG: hypothetical protein KAV82_08680 [Phycisphaerae bacterium]|nr:hypothetical protein [Phycisphaerae bacterium]
MARDTDRTPPLLPDDPRAFWSAAEGLDELELPPKPESAPTLERLVPSPFPRSGFPLIGFLATVYDHVSGFARQTHEPKTRTSEGHSTL